MCIAILNPEDVTLEKSVLKTCWDNNTDGAGMLYLDGGVLKTHKEMKNFDSFYDKYLNIRKSHKDSQVVIHFRISTHGKVNETNCHPFIVNDSWGFVHNGIISNAPRHNDYSDTYMFNQEVLQKLPEDWIFNDGMYELVLGYIGSSKLLFLNTDNEAYILNEDMGVWDLGCWFSNNTYKESRYYDYGGKKVYKTAATSTITPSSTTSSFNSYKSKWAWDDDDDYSINEWVWDYDKHDYVKKEEVSKPQSEWSDDARDQYADTCEGCDTPTTCVYSMNYNASLCKLCCSDLVAWTEEDKDERPF
jgi:hypothetical protein